MSQFSSVYTSNSAQAKNAQNPSSIFKNAESGKADVFMPSTMTKLSGFKQNTHKTKEELEEIKKSGALNLLLNSQAPDKIPTGGKYDMLAMRYAKIEALIKKMRDPVDGVAFIDKKSMFDVQPAVAPGSEIVNWIFTNCKCQLRQEALQLFQIMVDHGYLISMDTSQDTVSEQVDKFYTFQTDYFFASRFIVPEALDYGIYLLRRSAKQSGNLQLSKEEIERFYKSQKQLENQWKAVVQGSERQKQYLHGLDKRDKRLIEIREYAFWKSHYPLVPSPVVQTLLEDSELKKKRMNQEEFVSVATDGDQLEYWQKNLQTLETYSVMLRVRNSVAIKSLIKNTELWYDLDPLLNPSKFVNPWHTEGAEFPVEDPNEVPSQAQVSMWRSSFKDMMSDPKGLMYFRQFLEKDQAVENLNFYLDCKSLENIVTEADLIIGYLRIGGKYILEGSAAEINIDSSTRSKIIEKLKKANKGELDQNMFQHAVDHVYQMMRKDCFPRFIQSEEVKKLVGNYKGRPGLQNIVLTGTGDVDADTMSHMSSETHGVSTIATRDLDSDEEDEKAERKRRLLKSEVRYTRAATSSGGTLNKRATVEMSRVSTISDTLRRFNLKEDEKE